MHKYTIKKGEKRTITVKNLEERVDSINMVNEKTHSEAVYDLLLVMEKVAVDLQDLRSSAKLSQDDRSYISNVVLEMSVAMRRGRDALRYNWPLSVLINAEERMKKALIRGRECLANQRIKLTWT